MVSSGCDWIFRIRIKSKAAAMVNAMIKGNPETSCADAWNNPIRAEEYNQQGYLRPNRQVM